MTPEEIGDRFAILRTARAALRDRSRGDLLESLARVLDGWRDPDSAWRLGLESELPKATGFSSQNVRHGLALGLADWTGDALRELAARELGTEDPDSGAITSGFETTAVALAGSIPMPSLLAMIAPLAVRSSVLTRPASRDPVTPNWVARSIAEVDPELGACIDVVSFPSTDDACTRALLQADCICATGSDATIGAIGALIRPPRRTVLDSHRLSVAAIADGADDTHAAGRVDLADRIALDVALWDQLGCLSPVVIFAVGQDPALADLLAESLALALENAEQRWPRGSIDPAAARDVVRERSEAELRSAAGRRVIVRASDSTAWTVIREDDCELRPAPLHRFVRVLPVRDIDALAGALRPFRAHLAAVAIEGFGERTNAVRRAIAEAGASRICSPGSMQCPPLGWHHAGRGVLTSIARFSDVEAAG